MIPLRQFRRLLTISVVLARYRLDDIIQATHLFRPMRIVRFLAPRGVRAARDLPRGERIRLALEELGPIFVKFGQVLSTRRDLLPPDIGDELALLQDRVAPFPSDQARRMIEASLERPIGELFDEFEDEPLASASVAQVHAARMRSGKDVVVKVLRPGIAERIERDLELLRTIAGMAQRYWEPGERVRPLAIVAELEKTIYNELDLKREAANASQLKRNFEGARELYIPSIHWDYTRRDVLVMERVTGIAIDDVTALHRAGVDVNLLAERGIRIFYTQVFRDNFFHADMHPGNILVNADDPADPTYVAMDFGIVGSLPPAHLYYLAENFLAFFNQDYRRVAVLHIESGWIPATVRVDELEAAVRTVCEPQFAKALSEISFAEVLLQLFEVARRYNLIVQPELVLLQKTLLNIEGLGRQVYPELDIWATAKPILEDSLKARTAADAVAGEIRKRLPSWLEKTPRMPGLIYDFLHQATGDGITVKLAEPGLEPLTAATERRGRRTAAAALAAGLILAASVLLVFDPPGPTLLGAPILSWAAAVLAALCATRALR